MIDLVSATRLSEGEFWNSSALGLSLGRLMFETRINACPVYDNRRGLSEIYNERILAPDCAEYLVFVHDDVWLDDYYLVNRVLEGLAQYDVIGVAGNRRRHDGQPSWGFVDAKFKWEDKSYLSGWVGHGKQPFGLVSNFGAPPPAECELLDGVFLAAKRDTLREKNVRFDPQFDFHLYDIDFCRTARQQGLRLGTWPIALTHQSKGSFGTESWFARYEKYLAKWGS
jgi:GT2 family glycosyltransferase